MAQLLDGSRTPPFTTPYFLFGTHVAFIACTILCARAWLSWSAVCPCLLVPPKVPACACMYTGAAAPAAVAPAAAACVGGGAGTAAVTPAADAHAAAVTPVAVRTGGGAGKAGACAAAVEAYRAAACAAAQLGLH
eukprot:scaffold128891_cov17-Tisochrysis_lutea.AAC.1